MSDVRKNENQCKGENKLWHGMEASKAVAWLILGLAVEKLF